MAEIRIGTSGYSYKQWKGKFYPQDLPDREMLSYYAEHHDSVEINSTFYRFPSTRQLENWAAQVGDSFLFTLKAPRQITHKKRLRDDAGGIANDFVNAARVLGDKLGVALFQLPPYLKLDLPLLEDFLEQIEPGARLAFEFRSTGWFCDAVLDCLRRFDAALCFTDSEDRDVPLEATAPFGYARLRRPAYDEKALRDLAARLGDVGGEWDEVFIYFKHEDQGPAYAAELRAAVGGAAAG